MVVLVTTIERKNNKPIVFEEHYNDIYHITLAHKEQHDAFERKYIESWKSITDVTLSELVLNGTINTGLFI